MWEGSSTRTQWIVAAVWSTVGIMPFMLLKSLFPSLLGFMGFLPT